MRRALAIAALLAAACSSPYSPINMTELPEPSARPLGSAAFLAPPLSTSGSAAPLASTAPSAGAATPAPAPAASASTGAARQ